MRVLVTGSAGFIGSHLVAELAKGHSVVEFDIKDSPSQDVRSLDAVISAAKGAEAIVHLAALTLDAESVQKPKEYYETNVIGTFNVLEAAHRLGIRTVLNASSAATGGTSPYGTSKLCGELLCGSYATTYGLRAASLRLFNVYGGGNGKGVVNAFFSRIKEGKPVTVHDDGEYVRDYVHVHDVVATVGGFLAEGFEPGVYEVGTGVGTSVNRLADTIEKIVGRKIGRTYEPRQTAGIRSSVAKSACVRKPISLHEGLRETWEDFDKAKNVKCNNF